MSIVDEHALRDAIDASLVGMAILDEDGRYRYVNEAHADVYGYESASAFLGERWEMCYTDAQLAQFEHVFEALEVTGEWRGEVEGRRANGTVFPQELSLASLDDGGLVCVIRDLTERYEHEQNLAALNESARGLMAADDRMAVADTVLDIAHRVLDETLIGVWFRADDAERLIPVVATPESEAPSFGTDARLGPIEPGSREWTAYEDGDPWFADDYAAVPNAERASPTLPLGSVGVFPLGDHGIIAAGRVDVDPFGAAERDVIRVLSLNATAALDRAAREAVLAASNERLDQFASVVSHDLRNPLSVIQGNAALAKETGEERYVDEVIEAADRMEHLVDDLLTLARQGETVGETQLVSLATVAGSAWNAVQTGDAELHVEATEYVRADPERLQTVFENLFRNSVEHGTAGVAGSVDAPVTVTVATDSGANAFVVADDGPGIPIADRERVFEHGYSTSQDGTGFGLAIIEQIATAHGWTVSVTNPSTVTECADDEDPSLDEDGACFRFDGVELVD